MSINSIKQTVNCINFYVLRDIKIIKNLVRIMKVVYVSKTFISISVFVQYNYVVKDNTK